MPEYKSGNIGIYYEMTGEGTPVVMLHGFSLDRRMWTRQTVSFAKDHTVIMPDARGHGLSEAPPTGYAREDRTGDLERFLEHLKIDRFHLLGFSMGGGDALAYAIDNQDKLISLTLVGTVAAGWSPPKRFKDFTGWARENGVETARQKYMDSILSYYDRHYSHLRDEMEKMMLDFSGVPWLDPMKGKYKKRDDLSLCHGLSIPTMLVVGQRDIFFRPLAEQLAGSIKTARLEIINSAGHMVNMEMPDEFNVAVLSFFDEAESGMEKDR